MFPKSSSYSGIPSLKNFSITQNLNSNDKNIKENLKSNFVINNDILNSYKQSYRRHKHYFPKSNNNNNNIINTAFSQEIKTKTNLNTKPTQNKYEFNNEDIKKIYEAIEDIKINQREIISAVKELKTNQIINNIRNKTKNEDIKDYNKIELLSTINKIKEDYDKLRKEMLVLKEEDDENKKIIELNRKEINNLKKILNEEENYEDNSDKFGKSNNLEIKRLKEALKKSQDEKNDLKNLNIVKDNEIKALKNQINEFQSKMSLMGTSKNFNKNVDKNLISNILENPYKKNENLKFSQALDFEPNSQINFENGKFNAEDK